MGAVKTMVTAEQLLEMPRHPGAELVEGEVIEMSPDRPGEMYLKIGEYFAAGTRLVWVIDANAEQVVAHHPDGRSRVYSGSEAVPGEDVLPGFSFTPSLLFT